MAVPEGTAKFREETSCSNAAHRLAALHNLNFPPRFRKRRFATVCVTYSGAGGLARAPRGRTC